MNNETTNNEVNILLEQKQTPVVKQDVCAAYLVEMVKDKQNDQPAQREEASQH